MIWNKKYKTFKKWRTTKSLKIKIYHNLMKMHSKIKQFHNFFQSQMPKLKQIAKNSILRSKVRILNIKWLTTRPMSHQMKMEIIKKSLSFKMIIPLYLVQYSPMVFINQYLQIFLDTSQTFQAIQFSIPQN